MPLAHVPACFIFALFTNVVHSFDAALSALHAIHPRGSLRTWLLACVRALCSGQTEVFLRARVCRRHIFYA